MLVTGKSHVVANSENEIIQEYWLIKTCGSRLLSFCSLLCDAVVKNVKR